MKVNKVFSGLYEFTNANGVSGEISRQTEGADAGLWFVAWGYLNSKTDGEAYRTLGEAKAAAAGIK